MPFIDVTEILSDPDIAGEIFTVIRRPETISQLGKSTVTEQSMQAAGAIFPTGDQSLVRQADFQSQAQTITVVTAFRLRGASRGYQPDIVVWSGSRYVVRQINEFTKYGAGFVEAECSQLDFVDIAPDAPTGTAVPLLTGGGL